MRCGWSHYWVYPGRGIPYTCIHCVYRCVLYNTQFLLFAIRPGQTGHINIYVVYACALAARDIKAARFYSGWRLGGGRLDGNLPYFIGYNLGQINTYLYICSKERIRFLEICKAVVSLLFFYIRDDLNGFGFCCCCCWCSCVCHMRA